MNFCINCGNTMKAGVKFCNKCGAAALSPPSSSAPALPSPQEETTSGGGKKASGKAVAITLVIILLLGAGIPAYGYFNGFDKLPLVGVYFANDGEEADMAAISEDEQASPASSPEPTATPTPTPEPPPTPTPEPEPLPDVDDIIEFGGDEWRVLEVEGGKTLVISEYVLEKRLYHDDEPYEGVTWADSDIRQYLNGQFLERFTAIERNKIEETRITNADNPWFGTWGSYDRDTPGGSDTTDYIFLLSLDEVVRYFGDSGQLENQPEDAYAIDDQFNDARIARTTSGEALWWWLRSPGVSGRGSFAAAVDDDGQVFVSGEWVGSEYVGVRPAMWLDHTAESGDVIAGGGGQNGNNVTGGDVVKPPEPSPRPMLADESIEAEITRVRGIWQTDREAMAAGQYEEISLGGGMKAFLDHGQVKMIEVTRNTGDSAYARTYNFEDGKLIFAYLEGDDAHRLYFWQENLFRWRHSPDARDANQAENYDNRHDLDRYLELQEFALGEAYYLYGLANE